MKTEPRFSIFSDMAQAGYGLCIRPPRFEGADFCYTGPMRKTIGFALIALVIGIAGGFLAGSVYTEMRLTDQAVFGSEHSDMRHDMDAMTRGLEGKDGDEFEEKFLEDMIVHHQGAVDMARQVLLKSQRPELRAFAESIITVQTSEIETMQDWKTRWFGN